MNDFKTYQNKLISIDNNMLILNDLINIDDSYVISIVGDARKGKSTFLNLMINYLTKQNNKYFNTSSTINHCTLGIDYLQLTFENKNYIFIDCQGLNYENATNDYKFLLLIYSMSNIIIYNDKNMINNNIFSTLQPMALFLNMFNTIDNKDKPILYFRIADYELDGNINDLITNLFLSQNDHYDNVRESIKLLFNKIEINATDVIYKNDKKLLDECKYNAFLSNTNTCIFSFVIKDIYDKLLTLPKKNLNLELLVNEINNNDKIDYKKLDIYTLNTQLEIINFIDTNIINNEEFTHIVCDGHMVTRILIDEYKNNITKYETLFNKSYASVPDDMKINFISKLNNIKKEHDKFICKNERIADDYFKIQYDKFKKKIHTKFNTNFFSSFNKHYDSKNTYIKEFLVNIQKSFKNDLHYDSNVYNVYKNKINEFLTLFNNDIDNIHNNNVNSDKIFIEKLKNYKVNINELIDNIGDLKNGNYGDYRSFIHSINPYNKIKLNEYERIDNNGDIEKYAICDIHIKKIYIDKYLEQSILVNFKQYYINKIIKIVNDNGIYFDKLNVLNIPIIELNFNKYNINLTFYIELTNFYKMLHKLNIDNIIFIESGLVNKFTTTNNQLIYCLANNQLICCLSNIAIHVPLIGIMFDKIVVQFINYVLQNDEFNDIMLIDQFNKIKSLIKSSLNNTINIY